MTKKLPTLAKRLLAFTLALVLMLSLAPTLPLTANAAYTTDGWEFSSNYATWMEGRFHSEDADLTFENDQPYDWYVSIYQGKTTANVTVDATVKNSSGVTVASIAGKSVSVDKGDTTMLNFSDLTGLTTSLYGTFTLTCTVKLNGSVAAKLTKTFRRVDTKPFTATVTSRSNPDKVFTYADPIDLVLTLRKKDGNAIACNAAVTVTNSSGSELLAARGIALPASTNLVLSVKDLVKLPDITTAGTYNVNLTLTDSKGTVMHKEPFTFKVVPLTGTVDATVTNRSNNLTGNIYAYTANPQNNTDINYSVKIVNSFIDQTVHLKAVGTLNSQPFESPAKVVTISANAGTATVTFGGTDLGSYGIFEDIRFVICSSNGEELWRDTQTYNFSRVLDTSNPGDMALLNMNDHFTTGTGNADKKIALMAQAGNTMWRASIRWAYVEDSKGNYVLGDTAKAAMDSTVAQGMKALIILAYGNEAVYGENNPSDTTWVKAYANYCGFVAEEMAKHYSNNVVGFEIWNEFNHSSMGKIPDSYRTPENYVKMVKAASEKIRAVNDKYGTNFKVIAGATAGDGYRAYETEDSSSGDFIEAMFKANGFFEAVDGVSFHTYGSTEKTTPADKAQAKRVFEYVSPEEHGFSARVTYYLGLVNKYNTANKEIEIWLTETGWSTNEEVEIQPKNITKKNYDKYTYGATEQEQAAYLVQMYAWALADGRLDHIFWYDFMNDLSNYRGDVWANDMTESNYGLIHNWDNKGGQPLAYSAKPGYVTMCALSSMLGNATNGQKFELDSGIEAYKFTDKNGNDLVVAWTTSDTTKTLSCSGTMTVTDMYGNTTSNLTTATLSECPIYITYSGTLSVG